MVSTNDPARKAMVQKAFAYLSTGRELISYQDSID